MEARQTFQEILFPKGLQYDILEKKYGTDDLSSFYSVICDKNEPETGLNSRMVHPVGFEPTTFCSEDRRSNPLSYGCIGTL